MISRRHLRIKVMQALFAYFLTEDKDSKQCEKELIKSVEKFYDSYLLIFLLLAELADISRIRAEDKVEKHIKVFMAPEVNTRFFFNAAIQNIITDKSFEEMTRKRMLTWQPERDNIISLFSEIKESRQFISYCRKSKGSFEDDKELIGILLKEVLYPSELFQSIMEEKCFYWEDDNKLVQTMVCRTINSFKMDMGKIPLMPLYKEDEDREFMLELLRVTIINDKEFEARISKTTTNWDVDRIALMDVILMKMSIAEMLHFSEIPEKVTINEVLEIAKEYSTRSSNTFINGIIDQIRIEYQKEGKIIKEGKGLVVWDKTPDIKPDFKKKKTYQKRKAKVD
jgi:N utilization substance protein B